MSSTLKKLNKLTKKQSLSSPLLSLNKSSKKRGDAVKSELAQVAKHSGLEVLSEMKAPLNPILSWFDEVPAIALRSRPSASIAEANKSTGQNNCPTISLARLPLKSPPCKKCPALNDGLCKCALKRFK